MWMGRGTSLRYQVQKVVASVLTNQPGSKGSAYLDAPYHICTIPYMYLLVYLLGSFDLKRENTTKAKYQPPNTCLLEVFIMGYAGVLCHYLERKKALEGGV